MRFNRLHLKNHYNLHAHGTINLHVHITIAVISLYGIQFFPLIIQVMDQLRLDSTYTSTGTGIKNFSGVTVQQNPSRVPVDP